MKLSSRLDVFLGRRNWTNLRSNVALASLAERFFRQENISSPPWSLFPETSEITMHQLLAHLGKIAQNDSVVQDLLTMGHLGKLLARFDTLVETENYELIGIPNRKLDALSRRDRVEFFDQRISLNCLTSKSS